MHISLVWTPVAVKIIIPLMWIKEDLGNTKGLNSNVKLPK